MAFLSSDSDELVESQAATNTASPKKSRPDFVCYRIFIVSCCDVFWFYRIVFMLIGYGGHGSGEPRQQARQTREDSFTRTRFLPAFHHGKAKDNITLSGFFIG